MDQPVPGLSLFELETEYRGKCPTLDRAPRHNHHRKNRTPELSQSSGRRSWPHGFPFRASHPDSDGDSCVGSGGNGRSGCSYSSFWLLSLSSRLVAGAGKCLPFRCRGKRIEVLVRMSVEAGKAGADDTPKIQECLFIDLVPGKQFGVVAKVPKEPTELPKRAFGAVEAPREGNCFMGGGSRMPKRRAKKGFWGCQR